jgi:hypothetical protein
MAYTGKFVKKPLRFHVKQNGKILKTYDLLVAQDYCVVNGSNKVALDS